MRFLAACLLALAGLAAPAQAPPTLKAYFPPEAGVRAGGVRLIPVKTPKGEFKVWTKRFGSNPRLKVLLLHGGPGATHEYFESFEGFLPAEGVEFIYYDQLGSAFSDQPKDKDLWTVDRFVDEVEQVRAALGLTKEGKGNVQAHRPLSLSSQGLDRQPQAAPYIQMGLPTKRVEKGEKL